MTAEHIHQRFKGILVEVESYVNLPSSAGVLEGHFLGAMNLISKVFGTSSDYYKSLEEWKKAVWDYSPSVSADLIRTILTHALQDYEAGLMIELDTRVTGEVISDLVRLAKLALREEQKDVAAVSVAAALEDSLKRCARLHGLDITEEMSLTQVINALKSDGLRVGGQKDMVNTLPALGNAALHANWSEIVETDVASVIGFVEQFLRPNFRFLSLGCVSCGPSGAAWSTLGSSQLGTVLGRAASRPEDSPARTVAGALLVGLLRGGRRSGRARAPHRTAPVRSPGAPAREDGALAVRVLRGGRGAGHRRGRVALSGRPPRPAPGRLVFRRRPPSADLPDAVLVPGLGVDIRWRSHTLRVNYRTSHQIRRQADRLLPSETSDVDGNHRPANRHRLRVQRCRADHTQMLPSPDRGDGRDRRLAEKRAARTGTPRTRWACSSGRMPN